MQGPEWQGAASPPPQTQTQTPPETLAYRGQKLVLTMGSTLIARIRLALTKHGQRTRAAMEERRAIRDLIVRSRRFLGDLKGTS